MAECFGSLRVPNFMIMRPLLSIILQLTVVSSTAKLVIWIFKKLSSNTIKLGEEQPLNSKKMLT